MEYVGEIKIEVDKNASTLNEAVKIAKDIHKQVETHMTKIAENVTKELESRMKDEIAELTKGMDTIEENIDTVYTELKRWRKETTTKVKALDQRVGNIEHFLLNPTNNTFKRLDANEERDPNAKKINNKDTTLLRRENKQNVTGNTIQS